MSEYEKIKMPEDGEKITFENGVLKVPDNPIIPYITGDGIGVDVVPAALKVLDSAAGIAGKNVTWLKIYAGEEANKVYGSYLPDDTLKAIEDFRISIKGPLTTPIGGGFRSLNVTIRQTLDLYANVRPVYYLDGIPSPVKAPEKVDIVIFRESTEDVYAGIEWRKGSEEAKKLIEVIKGFGPKIREDSGIGIKPISEFGTKRLVRLAIKYAIENNRKSVTLVHKGNIMKYTEGAFKEWGYEVAEQEFPNETMTEDTLWEEYGGDMSSVNKIVIKDRIADNMFQQLLIRTDEYDVIALPNLNGDYISDAAAAMVGGLGIAPGSNVKEGMGVFEPVHGSAPKYAGQNKVNPTAEILTGALMFEYMGWKEPGKLIKEAVRNTIKEGIVTYDIHRQTGGTKVGTKEFAEKVVENLNSL